MTNLYGIGIRANNKDEVNEYYVGRNGYIPLILLVLYTHKDRNAVKRYLSVYAHTEMAKNLSQELDNLNPNLQYDIEKIVEIFDQRDPISQAKISEEWKKNGMPVFKGFPKSPDNISNYIDNYPRDTILDFNVYAAQLSTYMTLKTPQYDSGREGTPQACSMSYIAFFAREEFKKATEAIDTAFSYLVNEIARIMKLRGIEVTDDFMIKLDSYKAISFEKDMYPGF